MTATHVAVAGATGYLGRHIVRNLSKLSDVRVTALIRSGSCSNKPDMSDKVFTAEVDVADSTSVQELFDKIRPTHVINASSYGVNPIDNDFKRSVSVNIWGTYDLIQGAAHAGVKRFVQVGTYFEYGPKEQEILEEDPIVPAGIYASTKAAASTLTRDRRICGDMETVLCRAFHLWGSDEAAHRLTPQVISACRKEHPLDLTSGLQEKDFTYVGDTARWLVAITLHPEILPHQVFNVAGGQRCSVRDFVSRIASQLGGLDLMQFGKKPMPEREPLNGLAATSRLTSLLGPLHPTPLSDALNETIAALSDQ